MCGGGSEEYKEAYYKHKFPEFYDGSDKAQSAAQHIRALAHAYVTSLCWVLQYYYQGCVSWTHFFPYRYLHACCHLT
jgi:5'-3' exonuclease